MNEKIIKVRTAEKNKPVHPPHVFLHQLFISGFEQWLDHALQ